MPGRGCRPATLSGRSWARCDDAGSPWWVAGRFRGGEPSVRTDVGEYGGGAGSRFAYQAQFSWIEEIGRQQAFAFGDVEATVQANASALDPTIRGGWVISGDRPVDPPAGKVAAERGMGQANQTGNPGVGCVCARYGCFGSVGHAQGASVPVGRFSAPEMGYQRPAVRARPERRGSQGVARRSAVVDKVERATP